MEACIRCKTALIVENGKVNDSCPKCGVSQRKAHLVARQVNRNKSRHQKTEIEPSHQPQITLKQVLWVSASVLLALSLIAEFFFSPPPIQKQNFASPHYEINTEVITALTRNRIRGCGELKIGRSLDESGNYIALCTRDGVNWKKYYVESKLGIVTPAY